MTKAEIATIICDRVGLSKKESAEIVEILLEEIKGVLAKGEDVKISGFGQIGRKADEKSSTASVKFGKSEQYSEINENDEWTAIQKFNTLLHFEE